MNRKKRKDGEYYKEYYFYACKHRLEVDGHRCDYHHQWKEALIDEAVAHAISRLVQNPDFEEMMKEKINMSIDTREADQSLENGQVLKSMKFKFPVFYQGQTIEEIRWDKENTVESIVLLSRV